jgi:hypothetical protein
MAAYDPAKFEDGAAVRISTRAELERFLQTWNLHNKLQPEQLLYGGETATVEKSFMYHGGDVLYQLKGVPGIWHERLLQLAQPAAAI